MSRAQTVNANRPAVREAILAVDPSVKGDELNTISSTISCYMFDHNYSLDVAVREGWFAGIVTNARSSYDDAINAF